MEGPCLPSRKSRWLFWWGVGSGKRSIDLQCNRRNMFSSSEPQVASRIRGCSMLRTFAWLLVLCYPVLLGVGARDLPELLDFSELRLLGRARGQRQYTSAHPYRFNHRPVLRKRTEDGRKTLRMRYVPDRMPRHDLMARPRHAVHKREPQPNRVLARAFQALLSFVLWFLLVRRTWLGASRETCRDLRRHA